MFTVQLSFVSEFMRNQKPLLLTLSTIFAIGGALAAQQIGETPAVRFHMSEADIEAGRVSFKQLVAHGQMLFTAVFNRLDGQGRPGTTADAQPRAPLAPAMMRTAGPEAHSCASCHNRPRSGGSGDFNSNVFVMPESITPTIDSVSADFANERKTLGLFGSSPIEMLAREMSEELSVIRFSAINQAVLTNRPVTAPLVTKGVDFGTITARVDGSVDLNGVRGVSSDLIVRPFHQTGAAVSLREFTNDAMNQHLGIQSSERFGLDVDADGDGVVNELTVGDMTAICIFQAQLATPGRVFPEDPEARRAAEDGERLFQSIGCTSCHIPALKLKGRKFTEPNPFNPNWKIEFPVNRLIGFDMTADGESPRLETTEDGGAIVRAYTDLKRHNLCDSADRFFCNEKIPEKGIALGTFLTRRLWDIGSYAAFGHRGDLSMMTEAIGHHAGEARPSRERFMVLSSYERASIIEFLKTLQVLPQKENSPPETGGVPARHQIPELPSRRGGH